MIRGEDINHCKNLTAFLGIGRMGTLAYLRALAETGRLHRAGLIAYDDIDDDLPDRVVSVDTQLVEKVLAGADGSLETPVWAVASQSDLLGQLARLTKSLRRRATLLDDPMDCNYALLRSTSRRINRLFGGLYATIQAHQDWSFSTMFSLALGYEEMLMVLALTGRELGHVTADDPLFTALGLARGLAPTDLERRR